MSIRAKAALIVTFSSLAVAILLFGGDREVGAIMDGGAMVIRHLGENKWAWIAILIGVGLGATFFSGIKEALALLWALDQG